MNINELNEKIELLLMFNKYLSQAIDFETSASVEVDGLVFELDIDFKVALYKENTKKLNRLFKEKERMLINEKSNKCD